jgi:hypothetical protein
MFVSVRKVKSIDWQAYMEEQRAKVKTFDWQAYLEEQKAIAAPARLFKDVSSVLRTALRYIILDMFPCMKILLLLNLKFMS